MQDHRTGCDAFESMNNTLHNISPGLSEGGTSFLPDLEGVTLWEVTFVWHLRSGALLRRNHAIAKSSYTLALSRIMQYRRIAL